MPDLVTVENVELVSTGTWDASTGEVTIQESDLHAMITAAQDEDMRDPVLKIGHKDGRFATNNDGNPALGWVRNLRVEPNKNGGKTLMGDYVSVPRSLADLIVGKPDSPAPYRSRSVEIIWDVKNLKTGTKHPAVLTAVALLGEDLPAIQGLADVYDIYKTAASWNRKSVGVATRIHSVMGNTDNLATSSDQQEAYTVTLEEIKSKLGLPEDADDAAVMAKLDELKNEERVIEKPNPLPQEQEAPEPDLDLSPPQPEEEEAKVPVSAAALPKGIVAIAESTLKDLKEQAAQGAEALAYIRKQERDAFLSTAMLAGKFTPAQSSHFASLYDANPDGTKALVDSLAAGTVPVSELGHSLSPEGDMSDDAVFAEVMNGMNITEEASRG